MKCLQTLDVGVRVEIKMFAVVYKILHSFGC